MQLTDLSLRPAGEDDFLYAYRLCELTMRSYVEADLGNCFEQIARPTIQKLLQKGVFSKIYAGDAIIGVVAQERHTTHIQFEEIYIEPGRQGQGLGTKVMKLFIEESESLALPIRLHVLSSNPALAFYEKLGFKITQSTAKVNFMEYSPSSVASDA